MNFNLFQSSNNNNNQLGQSPLDFMSDDDGELDFSAVMQQELESHDLLLMQSEAAHHHPLSPPTVIIPSSSSNNINNNCAAADDGDLYKSNVLASVGDHHQNMMFPLNFVGGHTTPHVNTTTSNDQQQHSPRTPRLNLDAASVLQSWLLILDTTITNNNNNSSTTPIHNNNNNNNLNLNLNNNNNINLNNINHHITYNNNTTSDQSLQDTLENLIQNNKHHQQIHDMLTNNNNNSNNTTTTSMQSQSYLGSVLANCTSIHSPNMRSTMNQRSNNHSHQHSKSPSFGSGNYNSKLNSGVRKASSQRSNSTSCFQSIQSYTASKMHLAAAAATSMMNMNGGLNSPSVASTCSSNLTMSPANVSTNSFNQLINNNNNNGHMGYMSNSNSNNNNSSSATVGSSSNQQYSPIVTNQQQMVAGATVSGSNKKGKLPANRPVVDKNCNNQFTFVNSQHSKGLLVEANPNDKPIKMQQCKIVDGGIKIQIEDGISKNKKDTGLQFHTCTFK